MGATKRIVCLANSFKRGGLCIAGRELTEDGFGPWVRPVSARPSAELTYLEYRYDDYTSPELLDIIEVPILCSANHGGHQTENSLIDSSQRWVRRGKLAFRQLDLLAEAPESLWLDGENGSTGRFNYVSPTVASGFRWSLCLLRTRELWLESVRGSRGDKAFRVSFEYKKVAYTFSVTDPVIRDRFDPKPVGKYQIGNGSDIFLCVSLSEVFQGDGRCHKLVASIITGTELLPA